VLAPMTSLELCTDRMSDFMRSDKPSSFCNYSNSTPHPAAAKDILGTNGNGCKVVLLLVTFYLLSVSLKIN
jgi:hypothetical protein